jgi:acetyl esterase/lipase
MKGKAMKAVKCFSMVLAACLVATDSYCTRAAAPAASPTQKDVAYDDADPAQKLDVYLAESDKPTPAMVFIHGGGWRAGSKNRVPGWLMKAVREGAFSVVSVEYRFSNVAPHPAQVNDCLRAIQFVRHNAADWNIDPERIGVTGGSAGGHLSLWVALHDDVADPESDDPVKRCSSRVACAVSFAGPTDWSLLSQIAHNHPAYRQLLGYEPRTPADEMDARAKKDVSPITFVSRDDPPVMQVHGDNDTIVPIEHARNLHERLKSVGVKTELVVIEGANHGVAGAGAPVTRQADKFVREHLSP